MSVTAMMTCTLKEPNSPLDGNESASDEASVSLGFEAIYRPTEERTGDEVLYGKYTPHAQLMMSVVGDVANRFVLGQKYKLSFDPID